MKELLYLKDDQLKEFIEKISMSYRETFSDAKKVLDKYSIGVAHHKVINLISLYDGITISELLKKLKVTKQSLNRVLKDLIRLKAIKYEKGKNGKREFKGGSPLYVGKGGTIVAREGLLNSLKKKFGKNLNNKSILSEDNILEDKDDISE